MGCRIIAVYEYRVRALLNAARGGDFRFNKFHRGFYIGSGDIFGLMNFLPIRYTYTLILSFDYSFVFVGLNNRLIDTQSSLGWKVSQFNLWDLNNDFLLQFHHVQIINFFIIQKWGWIIILSFKHRKNVEKKWKLRKWKSG